MPSPRELREVVRTVRRRIDGAALELALHSASRLGRAHPAAARLWEGVECLQDVSYGGQAQPWQRLDVYRPRGASARDRLPALLYVHGGGFRVLSKESHWMMALPFARRGFVVFNIDYRLAPSHPYPAALRDVAQAYFWLSAQAGRFGADPDRVLLAGESAGGNLISALTLMCCHPWPEDWAREVFGWERVPRAVLAACPMMQVSDPERRPGHERISPFVRSRLRLIAESYLGRAWPLSGRSMPLANPIFPLEEGLEPARPLPPFFVSCGERDPIVEDSRRLERALRRSGSPHEAYYYPGEGHAFHALWWREEAQRCWRDMLAFAEKAASEPAPRTVQPDVHVRAAQPRVES